MTSPSERHFNLKDAYYFRMYEFLYSRHFQKCRGLKRVLEAQVVACGSLYLNTDLTKMDVSRISGIHPPKAFYRIKRHVENLDKLSYAVLTNRYWKQLQENLNEDQFE